MAPFFYVWGSNATRPEIPGTHFIDLGRMKG